MRFDIRIEGDLRERMEREIFAAERAVTGGIRAAGSGLKMDWRAQLRGGGLGDRLARAIRANTYPARGESIGAAALVHVKGRHTPEVIDAHDRGALIRSRDGFWLAIPTAATAKLRGPGNKRITPLGFERKTGLPLRFVYRRGKPSLLVVDQARVNKKGRVAKKGGRRRKDGILTGEQTVIAFLLVPQVKLPKRTDLGRDAAKWGNRLAGMIVARWKDRS